MMFLEGVHISGDSEFEENSAMFFGKESESPTHLDKSNQQNICTPEVLAHAKNAR